MIKHTLILSLIFFSLSSCKSPNAYEASESNSRVSSLNEQQTQLLEKVLKAKQGETCSTQGIFNCIKNNKRGAFCYSQCDVGSKYFCPQTAVEICIKNDGGSNACHAKYCKGGGEGEFLAEEIIKSQGLDPDELMLFPRPAEGGIGYEFYAPYYMKYGTRKTIARVQELAKRLFRKTGHILYIGDLSNASRSKTWRHYGHLSGKEVDFAIIGNSPANFVSDYDRNKYYDRHATRVLIKELKLMGGVKNIFFNDPVLINEFPGFVQRASGHYNHIHVNWNAD